MILLWWAVVFNFERTLVGFSPQRLVTEGVITLNAVICTVLMALGPQGVSIREPISKVITSYAGWIQKTVIVGLIAAVLMTLTEWRITHAIYGNKQAPGAGLHIRFGPNAKATKAKPQAGQKHP